MAITEKTMKEIQKGFEKHNEKVMNLYKKNGDKNILELLYLDSDDPDKIAENFGISREDAATLVEKDKSSKNESDDATEKASKYYYDAMKKIFQLTSIPMTESSQKMFDAMFGMFKDSEEKNDEEKDEKSDDEIEDETDDEEDDDSDDDEDSEEPFDFGDLFNIPEKIIEGLDFLGDLVEETSEKICDVLDEATDTLMEHDFDI